MSPKALLHIEGLFILLLCLLFYYTGGFSWILFIVLLFTPDLTALGYLVNIKIGTFTYNLVHTYTFSLILILLGVLFSFYILVAIGIIFTAHIGMDRLCGFGLKYPTEFKDTHLNRV